MKFVSATPEEAAKQIASAINQALAEKNVLWLVSGGSNIELAVEIRKQLELKNSLTVGLIDERYGPVGHPDSNWTQLIEAGFNFSEVQQIPVLQNGLGPEETAKQYEKKLATFDAGSYTVIGLFGMGSDGHTAGILPDSSAVDSKDLVAYYEGLDFKRITTTRIYFNLIDMAFLAAYGESKTFQLHRLQNDDLPVNSQPAQALKDSRELIVYNDQIT